MEHLIPMSINTFGIEYLLKIAEERPIPWRNICAVAILDCVQIVIGGVLIATCKGAAVGMNLIAEGLSDLVYAYRSYSTRQFDWTDYGKQKTISLIISVCSLGFGKWKDAGSGLWSLVSGETGNLAKEAGKQVIEAGTATFISNSKAVGQGILQLGENLKSLAFKYIGTKAGETILREGMNAGVQYLTNISMDAIRPIIISDIERKESDEAVEKFLDDFLTRFSTSEETFSQPLGMLTKTVADKLTDQIIRIIDSQLISPWSTYAVSSLTDKISQRIQHCLSRKAQNSDEMNQQEERCAELKKKRENGETLSVEERQYLQNFDSYRTFGQQINANAQAYCMDWEQMKVKYYSEHSKEGGEPSEEVKEYAEKVKGKKPAGMAETSTLAKMFGLKLKVTKDIGYKPTQEEIDQGVKIIYILPGEVGSDGVQQVGHAMYVDDKGTMINVPCEENDCLYATVSHILESKKINMSPQDLRNATAGAVLSNGNFGKVLEAERSIKEMDPRRAKDLLFSAGLESVDGKVREEYDSELRDVAEIIEREVLAKYGDEQFSNDTKTDTIAISLTSEGEIIVAVNAKERAEAGKDRKRGSFYPTKNNDGVKKDVTFTSFGFHNPKLAERVAAELMKTSINNVTNVPIRLIEETELMGTTVIEQKEYHHSNHAEMKLVKDVQQRSTGDMRVTLNSIGINKIDCQKCHNVIFNYDQQTTIRYTRSFTTPEGADPCRASPDNWQPTDWFDIKTVCRIFTDGTSNQQEQQQQQQARRAEEREREQTQRLERAERHQQRQQQQQQKQQQQQQRRKRQREEQQRQQEQSEQRRQQQQQQ